mmetsp:Transcript_95683/g.308895  ORF Transcript_95683/g.308895 Transcript_95683/m.308895 type:complete len:606 (+) Transcript_95683:95-1912(+)
MSLNSFCSSAKAASSKLCSCSPLPIHPRWPARLPGWSALWQSDSSRQSLVKVLGAACSFSSAASAAASASPGPRAAPSRRAAGSAVRSCWCLRRTCRRKIAPSGCLPAWAVLCLFAAGPASSLLLLPSRPMHTAPTEGAEGSASRHQRRAAALGHRFSRDVLEASLWFCSAAVAPQSIARRQLEVVGTCHEVLSGSMRTMGEGKRKSRAPNARLVVRPTRSRASCRGKASWELGRLMVSTASLHMATARLWSVEATLSIFESLLIRAFAACSASSATCSVSVVAARSTPSSSAAPSRVCTSARSTRWSSRQASPWALSMLSSASLALSRREKARLKASTSASSARLSGCTRSASRRYAERTAFSSAGPPGSICNTSKVCLALRILCSSPRPSGVARCSRPPCTMPRASSTRSRSGPAWKSLVPASSCRALPSSKSKTTRTWPTPETTRRSPSSRPTTAAQPLKACGLLSNSASSSRSTRPSASCSSLVSHAWIFVASSGMSFVWKFFAHQSAASALRRPWKSAKAEAGESTKLSGNFRARRAIFGSSFSSTVRSSLLPLRTALAPPARAVIGKSALLCGVSTSCHCFVFSSCMRYWPMRLPTCAK